MIEIQNLTKIYGEHRAVDNISFNIGKGELVGFLGPNGAGKTTTLNIITGYTAPTDGKVSVNGFDIIANPIEAKAKVGYLPDVPPLYPHMLVDEYLYFVCEIKKVRRSERKKMLADIKEVVRIEDMGNRVIGNLSKGYRQRVGMAQALVNSPEILILDEPTNGFDPQQIIDMRSVIKELGKSHTLVVSSHILSEISAICEKIIIIDRGKITAEAQTNELIASKNKLLVKIKAGFDAIQKVFEPIDAIEVE